MWEREGEEEDKERWKEGGEVESGLMSDGGVVECGIRGVGDEMGGEVVKGRIVVCKSFKGKEGGELVKELEDDVKGVSAG